MGVHLSTNTGLSQGCRGSLHISSGSLRDHQIGRIGNKWRGVPLPTLRSGGRCRGAAPLTRLVVRLQSRNGRRTGRTSRGAGWAERAHPARHGRRSP